MYAWHLKMPDSHRYEGLNVKPTRSDGFTSSYVQQDLPLMMLKGQHYQIPFFMNERAKGMRFFKKSTLPKKTGIGGNMYELLKDMYITKGIKICVTSNEYIYVLYT